MPSLPAMATTRRNGALLVLALAVGGLVGGASLSGCGENAVPERPSYARDIAPLMGARCIRCHGAGGTLNTDPAIAPIMMVQAPKNSDFATPGPGGTGIPPGLLNFTGGAANLFMSSIDTLPMPPPP